MKKKRIVKKVSLFFVMLLVLGNIQLLPVSAGASNIVINSNSFEKELDTSLWNNPDHDITIQNGVLIFSKDSTNSTALVSKVNARNSEQHTELIHANINMKFTQLPSDQKFILAFGLASVESTYGEVGNVEVEFTNNGGLKAGVVAYGEDETEVTIAEPVACGTVGNVLKIQAAISTDGIVTLQINNKKICKASIPVSGEGRFGFLQTGSCGAEVHSIEVVSHEYDQPENCDIYEDFEEGTINVNELTSKMILGGHGYADTGAYVDKINENGVFRFQNTSTTYLGTLYQYSNFEITFDVLGMQRKNEFDNAGNATAAATENFAISFGDEAADYNGDGYVNSADLVIFRSSRVVSLNTGKTEMAKDKGYNYSAEDCNKDFTVRLSVIDSVITVSMKWIDEKDFTEIMKYQISEKTPLGYVHIWTTGKSSTFAIDNLSIVNKDKEANSIEVDYKAGKIEVPKDFDYKPLEYVYEDNALEVDNSPYLIIPGVAFLCVIAVVVTLFINTKKKGGKTDGQKETP